MDIHVHIHNGEVKEGRAPRKKRTPSKGSPSTSKPKRKPSAYSKKYGAAYKRLKQKHPRMSFGALSKKAHKEAKK